MSSNNRPIVCGNHGRRPWKGHIACEKCGWVYQTQQPDQPNAAPDLCECRVRLKPVDNDRAFSARPICDLCYQDQLKRQTTN